MGLVLIIWDRLFGTFQTELLDCEYEPIKYGLTKPLRSQMPVYVLFHEWADIWKDINRKDIAPKQKIGYLLGRPGWSHDGSRLTSDQLRKKLSQTSFKSTLLPEFSKKL